MDRNVWKEQESTSGGRETSVETIRVGGTSEEEQRREWRGGMESVGIESEWMDGREVGWECISECSGENGDQIENGYGGILKSGRQLP